MAVELQILDKSRVVERIALAAALATAAASAVRGYVGALSNVQIYLLIAGIAIFLLAWRLACRPNGERAAAVLVLFVLLSAIAVFGHSVGGVNGPVVLVLPLAPAAAIAMLGLRAGWVVTVIGAAIMAVFLALHGSGYAFPESGLSNEAREFMRALFILLTTGAVCLVCRSYVLQQQRLTAALREVARMDFLTGLPNRRALAERLHDEFRRAQRNGQSLAIIMADLDYFKRYNDSCGHAAGDSALTLVAQVMGASLRSGGDCAGRYGGEEFMVILPATSEAGAAAVAEKIRLGVEQLGLRYGEGNALSITLGIASQAGAELSSAESLVAMADQALYAGKDAGRNCVSRSSGLQLPPEKPGPIDS